MIKTILITSFIFIISCTHPLFKHEKIVCYDENADTQQSFFPVKEGNKFEFNLNYNEDFLAELNEKEKEELPKKISWEIKGKKEIFNRTENGKDTLIANILVLNGDDNGFLYLIGCDKGTTIIEVNNPEDLYVKATLPLYDVPTDTSYWDSFDRVYNVRKGNEKISTNKGSYNTMMIESNFVHRGVILPNRKGIRPDMMAYKFGKSQYAQGLGLIFHSFYDENGREIASAMLEGYKKDTLSNPLRP